MKYLLLLFLNGQSIIGPIENTFPTMEACNDKGRYYTTIDQVGRRGVGVPTIKRNVVTFRCDLIQ